MVYHVREVHNSILITQNQYIVMGKITSGFPGGFSGRVGNVVGYMWCGKWCVRAKPVNHHDAKSEMQLAQRNLFKQTVGFAARARQILRQGLKVQSRNVHMTEYNYFMSVNKRCFSIVDGALAVDYGNLILSDGPVAPVAFAAPQMVDETTISVDFEKNPLHRVAKSSDAVYLAVYCPELGLFDLSLPAYRWQKQIVMSVNRAFAGREVHLWGFVQDDDGRASLSQYIGCGILSMEQTGDEALAEVDVPMESVEGSSTDNITPANKKRSKQSRKNKASNQAIRGDTFG